MSGLIHAPSLVLNLFAGEIPTSPAYEEVTANAATTGRITKQVVNGREYWVAPMTLIVPGVLAGSMGPLYYPPEEIQRDYQAWNGMPLVRLHPTRNGSPVSGRHPDVMGTEEMGRVYNARIGTGGRLQADGWFDVEATRRIDPTVLERLARGDPIELSTGLFTVNQPGRGEYQGKPYIATARDYRPDHLAVLPDRTGACSLRDGCGILINEQGDGMTTADTIDLTPADDYQPTGDPYLDAVVNCMSPKHPGPCAGKFGKTKAQQRKEQAGQTARVKTGAIATKGSGTAGKTSPSAPAGKPKVGAAFTAKGAGTRTAGGVASKASAAPAAPVKKPAREVKVTRSQMKAAKKLDAARKAALAKGDTETAAKATAKLKRIVAKADARAAGSTQVGKGAVGRKLDARAKETSMKQAEDKRLIKERKARSKGYKDSNERRKDVVTRREMARVKRADRKDAQKAAADKAAVTKVGRDVRSQGRETKAASKYVKAAKDAIAKGDSKKMAKIVAKMRRLKERAEKRVARNEETPAEFYTFLSDELAFVGAADRVKTLAENGFDLLDYHLVGNVLFTAPGRLALELHKLTKVANEAQITVNHAQGRDEHEWLLPPVLNRGGCPILYDDRPVAQSQAERCQLVRNAKRVRRRHPSDQLKKDGMTPEKACEIMDDGKVHGEWLTKAQKGMFGALCGQRKEKPVKNDYADVVANIFCPTGPGGGIKPNCTAGADKGVGPGAAGTGGEAKGPSGFTKGGYSAGQARGVMGIQDIRHGVEYVHADGTKVLVRLSTVHVKDKSGYRDPQKQKNLVIIDVNGSEHKAISTKGDSHKAELDLAQKTTKHLEKEFGIDVKEHFSSVLNESPALCGCGCQVANDGLVANCAGMKKCGACAAKEAMVTKVMNAKKCPYCGGMVSNGEGACPKCGMVMMGAAGKGTVNPAEPHKLMDNANPGQARADRGRWENGEKAALYHAMKTAFGGNEPRPVPAMADGPGQAAPASDADQDADAEQAHSVSNLFHKVMNAVARLRGKGKAKDPDQAVGCGHY
jgi:hypothetical protein